MNKQKYIRLYSGDVGTPGGFYTAAWCTPDELEKAVIEDSWLVDTNNLFGPDGRYSREEPTAVKEGIVINK